MSEEKIELHPGVHVALARQRMNETDIAKAIKAGELASPQQFANSWYFDLRLTGTGAAYRAGLKEYVWRDPSIYLNQDFLDRCNGLPIIIEHPKSEMLNTTEYAERNIGSVVLPYIKGDEVWGVARILDQPAALWMRDNQSSTSPGVVFSTPDMTNETIKARDGKHLLIEGEPNLLDHVAICEEGVWDKGGPPTGVDSTQATEGNMAEEMTKEEREEQDRKDKARRDAEEAAEKKAEEERMDAQRRHDEKIDKLLEGIKVVGDSVKKLEDAVFKDKKRDDASAEEENEQAEKLEELAAEEREEAEEATGDKKDKKRDDRKDRKREDRRDTKKRDDEDEDEKMPWAEADRKDGEEDPEYSDRMDRLASKHDAADYRKRDDESMAAHCDRIAAGARRDRARRADRQRMDSVDKLTEGFGLLVDRVARLTDMAKGRAPEEENAFLDAQARADSVYASHGEHAPRSLPGQSLISYRLMLLRGIQKHSGNWKDIDLGAIARADAAGFTNIEGQVYADAQKAGERPADVKPGVLVYRTRTLASGHQETTGHGDPLGWMSTFMQPGKTTIRLGLKRD